MLDVPEGVKLLWVTESLRVELRCKLPGKLHRVTGPLAHHVVLNHTFELLINTTMLFLI